MRGLAGKVIVVAGGASGIGAASAVRLAEEGASVVVGDVRADGARETADRIAAAGGKAVAVEFDLADEAACRRLIEATVSEFSRLDGLFNVGADLSPDNLGRDGDLVEVPLEVWRHTLDVNLTGYFYTSRYAIPALLDGGGGVILNMTSAVTMGFPRFVAYGAAKAGVVALSRHIACRWGKENIRCNAIDPGVVLTENSLTMVSEEERVAALETSWSPRLGEPGDTAAMVAFLMSDEGAWINGQAYSVSPSPDGH